MFSSWRRNSLSATSEKRFTEFSLRLILFCSFALSLPVASAQSSQRVNAHPKDDALCEQYQRQLNLTPNGHALPICETDIWRLPGAVEIEWESLDLARNLALLHRVEWTLRGSQGIAQQREGFAEWLENFQNRIDRHAPRPILKRSRVALVAGQTESVVYSYESGAPCEAKSEAAAGAYLLLPSSLERGLAHEEVLLGYPFMYRGALHVLSPYINNKTHFFEWAAVIDSYAVNVDMSSLNGEYFRKTVCELSDSEIYYVESKRWRKDPSKSRGVGLSRER